MRLPLVPPSCWQITGLALASLLDCPQYAAMTSPSFSSAFCRLRTTTMARSASREGLTASSKAYRSASVASSSTTSASG